MNEANLRKYKAVYLLRGAPAQDSHSLSVLAPDIEEAGTIFLNIIEELHPGSTVEKLTVTELCILQSVLLIDDDPTFSAVVESLLRDEGYQPILASDGLDALKLIDSGSFDVVLTDLRMPGATGLQVLEGLKTEGGYTKVPVIALTNYASSAVGKSHSFYHVISKPFKPKDLIDRLEDLAQRSTFELL